MVAGYQHIGMEERKLILRLYRQGMSVRRIGRELSRAPSTISREIQRNSYEQEVNAGNCHHRAVRRRRESYTKPRLKSSTLQAEVIRRLELGHSPELICGRLKYEGWAETLCHESIYQFIYSQRPDLREHLCRHHGKRKKFRQSKKTKRLAPIPQRISIAQRPKEVLSRSDIGHWESDLAISKVSPPALQVLVERKTRYTLIRKSPNKTGRAIARIISDALKRWPENCRKTITYDNGAENAGHRLVNSELRTTSFFCDPLCSWQKGTVENTVGLIRRQYPKGTDFNSVSDKAIALLQKALNSRPRKCLGFKTPAEAMTYEGVALQTRI
jgi:transposase, IS30 family